MKYVLCLVCAFALVSCSDQGLIHDYECEARLNSAVNDVVNRSEYISAGYHQCTSALIKERMNKQENKKSIGCTEFKNHLSNNGEKLSDDSWKFCDRYKDGSVSDILVNPGFEP